MLFRQLFDEDTATYTYLLADEDTREAVLIDPVREQLTRDMELLDALELRLVWVLETHVHADHVTSAGTLRERLGAKTLLSKHAGVDCADLAASDGESVRFGRHEIEVRLTPGHTSGDATFVLHAEGMAFTGDTLLIGGCGRTDFQQGDPRALYDSVHRQIFSLPETTRLYPAHDYRGRTSTTVGEEKQNNPRLGGGKTREEFVEIMGALDLPYPKKIDEALPANSNCGVAPWAPVSASEAGVPEVSARWVHDEARQAGAKLIDVRQPDEWEAHGRAPGAQLVPLASLVEVSKAWDPAERVVLVCRSGGRSGTGASALRAEGFTNVVSMRGGMLAWVEAGYPVEG
ncbi:MAG: MBL fold metallo-hydrolase [Nannocystaceae bacterium]|nr:MBL fold metallo-hydrolase [bacterium]